MASPASPYAEVHREMIAGHIRDHGQSLVGVVGSHTYTIGNAEHGFPELMINLPGDAVAVLLNEVGRVMRDQDTPCPYRDGEEVSLGGRFPVRIDHLPDSVRATHTVQAGVYHRGRDYAVHQVVVCDADGRWPEDPDCDEIYSHQKEGLDETAH